MPTPDDALTVTDIVMKLSEKTKIRRRCFRVEIDTPAVGEPIITFHQQDIVEIDGEAVATSQVRSLTYPFSAIQGVTRELTDPVTGKITKASMVWLAQCIRAQYVASTQKDLVDEAAAKAAAEAATVVVDPKLP